MRIIHTDVIIQQIKEMCIEANLVLSDDVKNIIATATTKEKSVIGKQILEQLEENMKIAQVDSIPICQDTGMAVVFIEIGQEVHIDGVLLEDAINEGIRQGYQEGYLRKSVVKDPLVRENTKDNTPGIIHYTMVAGDSVKITVAPKGFGSENMSRVIMLKPSDGMEGVMKAVIETVQLAGPNACPPMVVGVGIGGTFEKCKKGSDS
jgi:fumarate hydratase subunit alpha